MANTGSAGGAGEEWTIAFYHEAETDIRWAKERSSKVTYWSVLLSSALVVSSRTIPFADAAAVVVCIAQGGAAWLWLGDLHEFAKKARDWVRRNVPGSDPYPIPVDEAKDKDPHHVQQRRVQRSLVCGAVVAAVLAMV